MKRRKRMPFDPTATIEREHTPLFSNPNVQLVWDTIKVRAAFVGGPKRARE